MSIVEPFPVLADRVRVERTPPQDTVAEQCVLGGMLLSKDAIADVVEELREADFYLPKHQVVYGAILDLYGRGEPADAITVANFLLRTGDLARVEGAPYLHTLVASVPTAANAAYYARIVRETAIMRRLGEAGTRIVQMSFAGEGDVDVLVDRAQSEVFEVTAARTADDYQPLSELMDGALTEIDAIHSRGGAMVGVPTGFSELDSLTNGLHPGQMIVVAARPAMGKALALETVLPTPDGWTTMGDVKPGDFLLGADGLPTRVMAATEVLIGRPCHEVVFDDGSVIVADASHQWLTDTRASRKSAQAAAAGYNRTRNQRTFAQVRTTAEIAATLRCATSDRRLNHSVVNARPLQLPERELPIPPYVLGAWLGDGESAGNRLTTADPELVMHLEADGMRVVANSSGRYSYSVRLPEREPADVRTCEVCGADFVPATSQVRTCGRVCGGRLGRPGGGRAAPPTCPDCGRPSSGLELCQQCRDHHGTFTGLLRTLGVLRNKHIPISYLRGSEAQRRALLAGLLDTDGTVNRGGSVQFSATNLALAADVETLLASLGYRFGVSRKRVRGRTESSSVAVQITFTTTDDVFRLERKRQAHKTRYTATPQRTGSRFITAVRPVDSVPVRCVQVDNESHLYLAGRTMIPTHNSTIGLDLARAASIKNGLTSAIFSLEMARNEIVMRLLSAEAQIALHHMRSGNMGEAEWQRLALKASQVSAAPMFIDDSPNLTMMEIRAKCRRLKQRHDLRLVVIDYLQLMTSGKRVESRQQEVSEFSRSLKLLAKELEVPVIAISQLNRGPEQRQDKRPMLSDLRESGSIEQDADVVILLHREDAYERESARAGEADFIVAKHRNGPTATVTVAFQGHYSRFVDMATV